MDSRVATVPVDLHPPSASKMRFSVIIPTYNRVELLRQTLASLPADDPRIHEILVVDDGSMDETVDFLQTTRTDVTLIRQENAGPGSARNRGIDAATGDWVAFLDSDDVWFPWTLDHYEQAITSSGAEILLAKPFLFKTPADLDQLRNESHDSETRVEVFDDYFASGDLWRWWGASSFAVDRSSIGNARFPEAFINGEDSDWLMKLGHGLRVVQLTGTPTFGYREHDGSLMANWDRTLAGANHLVSNELCGIYPGGEARRKERRRILGRHLRPVMLDALSRGQRADALGLMRQTWRWTVEERRFRFLAAFFFRLLTTR